MAKSSLTFSGGITLHFASPTPTEKLDAAEQFSRQMGRKVENREVDALSTISDAAGQRAALAVEAVRNFERSGVGNLTTPEWEALSQIARGTRDQTCHAVDTLTTFSKQNCGRISARKVAEYVPSFIELAGKSDPSDSETGRAFTLVADFSKRMERAPTPAECEHYFPFMLAAERNSDKHSASAAKDDLRMLEQVAQYDWVTPLENVSLLEVTKVLRPDSFNEALRSLLGFHRTSFEALSSAESTALAAFAYELNEYVIHGFDTLTQFAHQDGRRPSAVKIAQYHLSFSKLAAASGNDRASASAAIDLMGEFSTLTKRSLSAAECDSYAPAVAELKKTLHATPWSAVEHGMKLIAESSRHLGRPMTPDEIIDYGPAFGTLKAACGDYTSAAIYCMTEFSKQMKQPLSSSLINSLVPFFSSVVEAGADRAGTICVEIPEFTAIDGAISAERLYGLGSVIRAAGKHAGGAMCGLRLMRNRYPEPFTVAEFEALAVVAGATGEFAKASFEALYEFCAFFPRRKSLSAAEIVSYAAPFGSIARSKRPNSLAMFQQLGRIARDRQKIGPLTPAEVHDVQTIRERTHHELHSHERELGAALKQLVGHERKSPLKELVSIAKELGRSDITWLTSLADISKNAKRPLSDAEVAAYRPAIIELVKTGSQYAAAVLNVLPGDPPASRPLNPREAADLASFASELQAINVRVDEKFARQAIRTMLYLAAQDRTASVSKAINRYQPAIVGVCDTTECEPLALSVLVDLSKIKGEPLSADEVALVSRNISAASVGLLVPVADTMKQVDKISSSLEPFSFQDRLAVLLEATWHAANSKTSLTSVLSKIVIEAAPKQKDSAPSGS